MQRSQEFFTQGPLHISYLPGKSDTLVLSFAGVGLDEDAIPGDEAARLAGADGENHVMFVSDGSRSWMNGPGIMEGIKAAFAQLVARLHPRRVVAMGNSMGGTAALIFAAEVGVNAVLSLVPQFSVHPKIVPWETRWQPYRNRIADWPYPAAPDLSGRDMQVLILHGTDKDEMRHAKRFAQSPDIDHYVVPKTTHGMSLKLKRQGLLQPIVSAFISGDVVATRAALAAAGGMPLPQYQSLRRGQRAEKRAGVQA